MTGKPRQVPGRYVFISFKSEERRSASLLRDVLLADGLQVWWHEDIQCGGEWHGDIDRALSDAACIVVLWSKASVASRWVQHEASHAIATQRYAPARIDPTAIASPFDRLQATDLIDWSGNSNHPGLRNLVSRIRTIVPLEKSLPRKVFNSLARNRVTVGVVCFAIAAVVMLLRIGYGLEQQLSLQAALAEKVERSLNPLHSVVIDARLRVLPSDVAPQYLAELRRSLQGLLNRSKCSSDGRTLPPGISLDCSSSDELLGIKILPTSPLWPDELRYGSFFYLVNFLAIDFDVRTTQSSAQSNASAFIDDKNLNDLAPDLRISARSHDEVTQQRRASFQQITWRLADNSLVLNTVIPTDQSSWNSKGLTQSALDLEGAQLRFGLKSAYYPTVRSDKQFDEILLLRSRLELLDIRLKYSGRIVDLKVASQGLTKRNDALFMFGFGYYDTTIRSMF